jgi:hypothetical protein
MFDTKPVEEKPAAPPPVRTAQDQALYDLVSRVLAAGQLVETMPVTDPKGPDAAERLEAEILVAKVRVIMAAPAVLTTVSEADLAVSRRVATAGHPLTPPEKSAEDK